MKTKEEQEEMRRERASRQAQGTQQPQQAHQGPQVRTRDGEHQRENSVNNVVNPREQREQRVRGERAQGGARIRTRAGASNQEKRAAREEAHIRDDQAKYARQEQGRRIQMQAQQQNMQPGVPAQPAVGGGLVTFIRELLSRLFK